MDMVVNNSTLYSIIRSGNVNSLKEWFTMSKIEPGSLYRLLGDAYEELHLKNVPICRKMQFEVEWRLAELEFVTQNYQPPVDDFKTFKRMKEHLVLTCDITKSYLSKYYNTKGDASLSFILDTKFIALHISVLKLRLDFTYRKIPWEEMEFCLVRLILNMINSKDAELTYELVLDKERVLNQLEYFLRELLSLLTLFEEEESKKASSDSKLLTEIRNLFKVDKSHPKGRSGNMQSILQKSPDFKYLYEDFLLLRDVYSLNRIKDYLDAALSVNIDDNPAVSSLVIQRTLQVLGEFLKSEKCSPNISEKLDHLIIKLLATNLQSTTHSLRDMLSHSPTLRKRLELESVKDKNIFKNIQFNFKSINAAMVRILFKLKIDALNVFLKKVLDRSKIEEIEVLFRYIDITKLDKLNDIKVPSLSHVKDLILTFWQMVKDSVTDDKTIAVIMEAINNYEVRIQETTRTYKKVIKTLYSISKSNNIDKIKNYAKTFLALMNQSDPKGIFEQEIFGFLHIIYKAFKKSRGIEVDNVSSGDQKLIEVTKVLLKIHDILKWDLQSIRWLEEMDNTLKIENRKGDYWQDRISTLFTSIKEKLDSTEGQIFYDAVSKEINTHLGKIKLLGAIKQDDFDTVLASVNLESNVNDRIYNSYRKKKYKEVEERIKQLIPDQYALLINNLENAKDIFPLRDYFNNLQKFYTKLEINKKYKHLLEKIRKLSMSITLQEIVQDYCKRLSTLQTVLSSIADLRNIDPRDNIIAALEILILDLTEYLEQTGILEDNKTFLVQRLPILNGKQLRNHLAHNNLSTHILPYNTRIPLLVYAKGLLELGNKIIIERGTWIVGFNFIDVSDDMWSCMTRCQSIVQKQDDLFCSIEEGRFNDILSLIQAGADIYSKDTNDCTALDVAIKNKRAKVIDTLVIHVMKNNDPLKFISPYVVIKDYETFSYLLEKTHFNLNFIFKGDVTLLHTAAELGQLKITEFLLQNMAEPNSTTTFGETALHLASRNGHLNIVILLLEYNGELIDKQTCFGTTALHLAAENGHCDVASELITRNANLSLVTGDNFTAFQLAIRNGHENIVKMILMIKQEAMSLEEKAEALLLSSQCGDYKVVNVLLKQDIDVNIKANDGSSALFMAAAFGHTDVVDMLVKSGAKVDMKHTHDTAPLHVACRLGHVATAMILVEKKANVDVQDVNLWTPLHFAFKYNHVEIIRLLISKGARIDAVDVNGLTPFHIAAEAGCLEAVELFIEKFPGEINCFTQNTKWSALHLAAGEGQVGIVRKLITNEARVNYQAADKSTALHWAIQRHGYIDTVTVLIQHEADVNLQDSHGATPLHTAVLNQNEDIVDILLEHNADVTKTNNTMYTPVHVAAMYWSNSIMEKLLAKVDNVDIFDHILETPLHIAATHGYTPIVNLLLKEGADCNLLNMNRVSALYLAAYKGHLDIVKLLVENGATINEHDDIRRTPLFMALTCGYEDIALFLIENGANVHEHINESVSILSSSIRKGMQSVVSSAINKGVNINEPHGPSHVTPLIMALLGGHESIALLLLDQDAIDVHSSTISGWTPLHVASGKGFKACLDKIILFNPDINAKTDKNETPLYFASEKGHDDIVKELVNHNALVNIITKSVHPTALSCAVQNGHQKVVEILIKHNADVNIKCKHETTPLHIAILAEYTEIAKKILECTRTFVTAATDNKWTALHFAALKGNSAIMSLILERGVDDIIDAVTDDGETALQCAAANGHIEIVKMLIENNADVTIKNRAGSTAAEIALNYGHEQIAILCEKNDD